MFNLFWLLLLYVFLIIFYSLLNFMFVCKLVMLYVIIINKILGGNFNLILLGMIFKIVFL